eukprot:superscaffoldBa00000463_g4907
MGITLEEIEISSALPINPTIIRIMRVLRIARVLKLLKMATGMRALLDTVVQALPQDTLRECPPDHGTDVDYACNPSLQFISPMYFVSFVLTAQFVLINVVVAVLMKHLDDSNKEAAEEAEMDAEIELELAQGTLCCMGAPSCGGGGEGEMLMIDNLSGSVFHHYSSPPPICKDCKGHPQEQIRMAEIEQASLKSEQLSDKSSSPALPDDLSLDEHTAYQLLAREGKISLQSPSMAVNHCSLEDGKKKEKEGKTEGEKGSKGRCSSDSHSSEEAAGGGGRVGIHQTQTVVQSQVQGFGQLCRALSNGVERETALQEMEMQTNQPNMCSPQCSPGGVSSCSNKERNREGEGGASGISPLFHLPADFFHPAGTAIPAPPRSRSLRLSRGLRLTSPASWASLRSPGAHSKMLCTKYPSHSDSSLATGSSEGSLQTTLEEGLSFSVSPPQNLELPTAPLPLVCPLPLPEDSTTISSPIQTLRPRPSPSSALTLQATRGHQRSQSSGRGSTSPGYTRDDSIDPSDEDLGIGIGSSIGGCGSSQAGNSEHLSETLSSLSLTSLLSPSSLVYPGGAVKKCNSTGSLDQGGMLLSSRGREGRREILGLELMDPQGFLANPWTGVLAETRRGDGRGDIGDGEHGFKGKSSSQTTVGPCRKNR